MQEDDGPRLPSTGQAEHHSETSDALPDENAEGTRAPHLSQQPDRFYRWTLQARATLRHADAEARGMGHRSIGDEHLLLGLLRAQDSHAAQLLAAAGASVERMRAIVRDLGEHAAGDESATSIVLTERGKRAILLAVEEARARKRHYVTTVHLLLAVVYGVAAGKAEDALKQSDIDPAMMHARAMRAEKRVPRGRDEQLVRRWTTIVAKLGRRSSR